MDRRPARHARGARAAHLVRRLLIVIRGKVYDFTEWKDHHPGGPFVARMYGGKDATAEFGEYHSRLAERHMELFCVGPLGGAPAGAAGDAVAARAAQDLTGRRPDTDTGWPAAS